VTTPPAFKEAAGWAPATPSDAADRKDWWTVFGDPLLNDLEARVNISNQTLAADEAAYRQARALVAQDRAALFPTITLNAAATATKSGGGGTFVSNGVSSSGRSGAVSSTYEPSIGGTWAPDIWGAVRRTIQSAKASAQASAATLANARLSAQTELAVDYIQMRQLDEQTRLQSDTVDGYDRTVKIVTNKYHSGVAARSDLLTAQSQLDSARATLTDLEQQRAKLEHAIAILTGQPPATLTIAPTRWNLVLPAIPAQTPSVLLQRRPDIAQAERSAAAANAQIGVQVAAYFPTFSLSGQGGFESSQLGQLFNISNSFWSVGASGAETLFDAGLKRAKVAGARAAYDQAVATYRQTVLTAFGQVEDNYVAQQVLAREQAFTKAAADEASQAEIVARNEYQAGTVDFTSVVTAEVTANAARNTELTIEANRLVTAVDLIEALGGGWTDAEIKHS
jgi:NodT family efflux transporter outer membrane factor (OMF) lipoprotein